MFAKIKDGVVAKFPYGLRDLFDENPNTKFSSTDLMALFKETTAAIAEGYELVQCRPILTESYDDLNYRIDAWVASNENGEWVARQSLVELTPEEKTGTLRARSVENRAQRNRLLAASDWTQLPDSNVDKAAWTAYRQALRDVPQQPGYPATVQWPNPPV